MNNEYTVVTHGVGYTETLESRGKTYKKELDYSQ